MLGRGGIGDFHSVSPTKFAAAGSCAENFRSIHTVNTLYVLTVKLTGDHFRIIAIDIFWGQLISHQCVQESTLHQEASKDGPSLNVLYTLQR